jgi:hypothetical protein
MHLDRCLNCHHVLEQEDIFCPHCGQRTNDGKLPVWRLLKDFFADQFDLDGRLWSSLRQALIPGKLTLAYFQGKRRSQLNPFRWFFFVAIAFLALIKFSEGTVNTDPWNEFVWYNGKAAALTVLDSLEQVLPAEAPDRDRILLQAREALGITSDSIDLSADFTLGFESPQYRVSLRDFSYMTTDSLLNLYGTENILEHLAMRQKIKLIKSPGTLVEFVLSNLAWMMVLYVPLIALLLKLIYVRTRRFYVEHLVFSLHQHTSFLLFIILLYLLSLLTNWDDWLEAAAIFYFVYLVISIKRYYQQHLMKTLIKCMILIVLYPILFVLFFTVASLFGILVL